jgi:hypothetical protein
MNVRARPATRLLAACLAAAGVALAAGCAAAPPGADHNSPAVGPVRIGAAGMKNFAPFPVPAVYQGKFNLVYQEIQKAKTGTSKRNFRVILRSDMVFWLNCIGKGKAQLASPGIGLKWDMPCGDGTSPGGINFTPKAAAVGHGDDILVTVTHGSRWEVRIDGIARKGIAPQAAKIPPRPTPSAS